MMSLIPAMIITIIVMVLTVMMISVIVIDVILKEILMIISVDILNDRAIYKRNLTNTRAFIQRMVVIEIIFSY